MSCVLCKQPVAGSYYEANGRIVYPGNRLAANLARAAAAGDLTAALSAWREALDLLPADTRRHATVAATISALSRRLDEGHTAAAPSSRKKSLGKGAAGISALARRQRWIAVAVIAATWFATGEGLLALLCVAAVAAAWFGHAPEEPDEPAPWQYASLVALLGAMTRIPVPVGTTG